MSPPARPQRLLLLPIFALLALSLSGCLAAMIADASEGVPTASSDDWSQLEGCGVEGTVSWTLVDDFPTEALDATGLVPQCGDIWTEAGRPLFASVVLDPVTTAQIESIRSSLESADYDLLFDDFDPAVPANEEYYGALDLYLDGVSEGDFTRVALEIYPSAEVEDAWMLFVDFESPSVRGLAG